MSSPSQVAVIAIPEVEYGKTPDLVTAEGFAVRFTGESLSGSPQTTASAELRTDRMSGGMVITGLETGGDVNFELSKDPGYEEFMAGFMMNEWVTGVPLPITVVSLTKDVDNDQLATIVITGSTADIDGNGRPLVPGDIISLTGFDTPANNVPVQVSEITSGTDILAVVPRSTVTETVATSTLTLGDYVDIGAAIQSWTLSKAYLDVPHLATTDVHSQRYTGSLVNTMSLNVTYGQIVTGTFGFLANGYDQELPSLQQKIETAGGTIEPAGTSNPFNGSIDMPTLTVDGLPTDFCIQSLSIDGSNNATPQNCIGYIAPMKYNLGTVTLTITASIYLGDQSYDKFMPAKLSMIPISIMFAVAGPDGGYAFDLRAVQLVFPDPSASGDSPVMIDASGTAKVGDGGASAMRIWRF